MTENSYKRSLVDIYTNSAEEVRITADFASDQADIKIHKVAIIDHSLPPVSNENIEDYEIEDNIKRIEDACKAVLEKAEKESQNAENLTESAAKKLKDVFEAHQGLLKDIKLKSVDKVKKNKLPAETAIIAYYKELSERANSSPYIQNSLGDIKTLVHGVVRHILKERGTEIPAASIKNVRKGWMIVGDTISPNEATLLLPKEVQAIALTEGTTTGHIATLASELGIPCCFFKQGTKLPSNLHDDTVAIFDPKEGEVIFNPSDETLTKYEDILEAQEKLHAVRQKYKNTKPVAPDTKNRCTVYANITPADAAAIAMDNGADGIGLWRTEFLFSAEKDEPSIQEQIKTYSVGLKATNGEPCTIRLVDREGDKNEGWLSKANIWDVRKNQIEALLKASAKTGLPINIMLPVVREVHEMEWLRKTIDEVTTVIEKEGQKVPKPLLGMMVEIPKTAHPTNLKRYMKHVDFVSIGSNDLVSWFSGSIRNVAGYEEINDYSDPALLQVFRDIIETAKQHGKPVSLCGNIASEPKYAAVLKGCGLHRFSVGTDSILPIKAILDRTPELQARKLVDYLINESDQEKRQNAIDSFNESIIGLMPDGTLKEDWKYEESRNFDPEKLDI